MESLGEWIHQANLKFAEELGLTLQTEPKETQGATRKIEIRFVNGEMARKMREFYQKQSAYGQNCVKQMQRM